MQAHKKTIRKSMLSKRKLLSADEISLKSKIITEILFKKLNFFKKSIHIYTPSRDGEVDTQYLIQKLQEKNISIYSSHTNWENKTMPIFSLTKEDYNKADIDIIFIPGIAFSLNGGRIGYGYGFYDRFLAQFPKAKKIALAYEWQITKPFFQEKYDITVDAICTEEKFILTHKK